MKKILLPEENEKIRYYRANLHCHSTISDGRKSPEQLKSDYKAHGYSILSITDHDTFATHNDMTDKDFLMLNGYEMEVNSDDGLTCHLCFVALDEDNDVQACYHRTKYMSDKNRRLVKFDDSIPDFERAYSAEVINNMIKAGRDKGFFVTYNHPTWSKETYPQYSTYKYMNAMEIVNYGCVVVGFDDDNGHCYDDILNLGSSLYCIATDDDHNIFPDSSPDCDSYGGYIMIASDELKYRNVADALEKGIFYSSTGDYKHIGPEIKSLYAENGKIYIKTSDASRIYYYTSQRNGHAANSEYGKVINEAEFEIDGNDKWFRIVVIDEKGFKAYTNAYFVKELNE